MSNPIDEFIGSRIAARREELGVSAQELSLQVGLPYSAYLDAETGRRRLGVSHLFSIAHSLDVIPAYFYQDYGYADHHRIIAMIADIPDAAIRKKVLNLMLVMLNIIPCNDN